MSLGSWTCRYSYSSSEYLFVFNPCSRIIQGIQKKKKKKKAEGRRKRCLPCWIVDRVNELFESIHLFLPQKTGFSIPPAHIDIHWDVYARVWLQMVVGDGGYNCRCDACVNWSNYQRKKQRTKRIENYTEIWGSGVVYAFLARQTAPYLGDSFASNRSLDYWNCVSTTNLIKSGGSREVEQDSRKVSRWR